jgi:hypothetical protein
MLPYISPSQRRQYAEAQAKANWLRADVQRLMAAEHEASVQEHRTDYFETDAEVRAQRMTACQGYAKACQERAAVYEAMGAEAAARAAAAQDEEIRADYYSGPPGSFTGD